MLRGLNRATDLHKHRFHVCQSRLNQGKNFGNSAVDDGIRSRGKSAIFGQIVDIHLLLGFSEGRWWSLTGLALRTLRCKMIIDIYHTLVKCSIRDMKKRSARAKRPDQTVHFCPGPALGAAINRYAAHWQASRDGAVKRLVILALEIDSESPRTPNRKNKRRKCKPGKTVQFRPGLVLGRAISEQAKCWQRSRGETAKILVTLAVNGLNKDFYVPAQELMQLGGDTKRFGRAVACIAVRIAQVEEEQRTVLSKPQRLRIAQELSATLPIY